jgi:hypothetical protein
MDLNYDPSLDARKIEDHAEKLNDYSRLNPDRRYARLWLRDDFNNESMIDNIALEADYDPASFGMDHTVEKVIKSRYKQSAKRKDVESADQPNQYLQLPRKGMIVRIDYCLYAHFFHLKKLLKGAEKVRFFLDQESGIRAACLSAFRNEILSRKCDAFYVSINKQMTIDERRRAQRKAQKELQAFLKANPILTTTSAKLQMLAKQLQQMTAYGQYRDRWFTHPFPTMAEPEKKVCYLTDFQDYSLNHRAWLYNRASLNGINIFFANLRRKQSMLERPISTPSGLNRKWYGYSPYNPTMINKILLIHRVWYNYARKSRRTKTTPAMKLGLAKAPIDIETIIYGRTVSEKRKGTYFLNDEKPEHYKDFLSNPEPEAEHAAKKILSHADSKPIDSHVKSATKTQSNVETVYLDTETTGTGIHAELIEIAIVDDKGDVMIADAPMLPELENDIIAAVKNKLVVIYASHFDTRFLTDKILNSMAGVRCCMRRFAHFYGRLTNRNYDKWESLKFACQFIDHKWHGKHHRALGDAIACRAVWRYLNQQEGR